VIKFFDDDDTHWCKVGGPTQRGQSRRTSFCYLALFSQKQERKNKNTREHGVAMLLAAPAPESNRKKWGKDAVPPSLSTENKSDKDQLRELNQETRKDKDSGFDHLVLVTGRDDMSDDEEDPLAPSTSSEDKILSVKPLVAAGYRVVEIFGEHRAVHRFKDATTTMFARHAQDVSLSMSVRIMFANNETKDETVAYDDWSGDCECDDYDRTCDCKVRQSAVDAARANFRLHGAKAKPASLVASTRSHAKRQHVDSRGLFWPSLVF
jgi:hypothetical protein